MTRAGLRAIGFELLAADDVASKTVTAALDPRRPRLEGVQRRRSSARGLVLAGGQGKLKGRIFRLGHLGSVTTDDILAAIGVLEAAAIEQRPRRRAGRGRRRRPAGAPRRHRAVAVPA